MAADVCPSNACPSKETLLHYSQGRLSEVERDRLDSHLDGCPDCQATIVTLDDADDTLLGHLRMPLSGESVLAEPELQDALAAAMAMSPYPAGDPAATPSYPWSANGPASTDPPSAEMPSTEMPSMLGEYRLLEELGRGGMGRVYKALHTKLDRIVALKVLPHGRVGDGKATARFEREMKAVGRLTHPNIVQAHDAREIDGAPVLIMEYVDGLDLAEIVRRLGPLPTAEACELVRQTALALQCAHEHDLVHRDIKPSNIMLARSGEVKLLDLGLARFYVGGLSQFPQPGDGPSPTDSPAAKMGLSPSLLDEMTATGQAMGTADYMAPEQAADSRTVDIRADLYSLGCTLYKLLSGHAPFSGPAYRTTLDKLSAHVHQPAPFIGRIVPNLPDKLAAVLDRLLAKDPGDRFATPAEVAEALVPWSTGADLPALLQRAIETPNSYLPQDEMYSSPCALGDGEIRSPRLQGEGKKKSPRPLGEGQGEGGSSAQPHSASRGWGSIIIRTAIALFFGGFCFAMGILITIKKDGKDTTVSVPAGSQATVDPTGNVSLNLDSKLGEAQLKPPSDTSPPIVSVAHPVVREIADRLDLLGFIEPIETAEVRPQVTGKLEKVHFQTGADVKQGDLLIEIDTKAFQEELDKTNLEVKRANTVHNAEKSQWSLSAAANIAKPGAVPDSRLIELRAKTDEAAIALAIAEKAQKEAQHRLDATKIVAPTGGKISQIVPLTVGKLVAPDSKEPVVTIVSLDKVSVSFNVDEQIVLRLRRKLQEEKSQGKPNARLTVHCRVNDSMENPYQGEVESIDVPVGSNGTATWKATLQNTDGALLPGMQVRVELITSDPHKALLIPERAVVSKQGKSYVLVVDTKRTMGTMRGDRANVFSFMVGESKTIIERQDIVLGQQEGDLIVVKEGLTADDSVVVSNVEHLQPGMTVRLDQESLPDANKLYTASQGDPQQSAINPAAELKALQGQWKVVRVEKGKDADVAWAYINAFGSPLDPATTDRFDFIGNASSGLDEEERDYLSIRKVDPRSRCMTDHLEDLHFRYRINSASTIKTIDISRSFAHRDGPTTLDVVAVGIYEFRGDRLRICLRRYSSSLSEAIQRPTSFSVEHDSECIFFEFERYRPSEDVKAMQGDWKVVAHTEDGREVVAEDGQPTTYRFDDPAIMIPDGHPTSQRMSNAIFALDAAKQPKQINLTTHYLTETYQEHEAKLAGIYQLEGDRLTIAYHVGEPRPEKFDSTPGSGVTLLVLQEAAQDVVPQPAIALPEPDASTGKTESRSASPETQVRIFSIAYGNATALMDVVQKLLPNGEAPGQTRLLEREEALKPLRLSVDTRTNSIIAAGDPQSLSVVEAILLRLDREGKHDAEPSAAAQSSKPSTATPTINPAAELKALQGQWKVVHVEKEGELADADWGALAGVGGSPLDPCTIDRLDFGDSRDLSLQLVRPAPASISTLPEINSHSTTCVHGFNYRIDPTTTPPTIDFLAGETNPNGRITKGDQLFSGIYKLDGDRLTIACRSGEWRPEEFESTPGSRITLFVLKRSKPEAGPKPGSPLPQHSEAPSKGNEPEQPSPNPAAELKALQDQWKVVRVEKGKDADVAWAYINAFGSPLDPATTDRFDFIGNAPSGLDEEERDYLSIRKVDPRSRCMTDHLDDLHFRYRINSASTIKTIDILRSFAHRDGPSTLDVAAVGIYEFRGDRLRIYLRRYSSSLSEAIQRPTSFSVEHDSECIFFEFERYRPSEDVKAMQGDWKVVTHIEDGRQVIAKDGQPTTYRFDDPAIVIPDGHPIPHGINNAIFALDAAKQPKQINLTTHYLTETYQEHEATLAGIYQLEGDRLTIAYHVGEPRPEKSESAPGSGVTLLVLERSKPQTSASDKPAEPEKTGPE